VVVERGASTDFHVLLKNFLSRSVEYRVEIHTPQGLSVAPSSIRQVVAAGATAAIPARLQATADAREGLHLAAFDITRDGQRHGELFDFIAHVGRLDPALDAAKPGVAKPSY
jgi:hypothetical protein